MKDWEVIAEISKKPVRVWAGSQPLILGGARSGLLTRTAATDIALTANEIFAEMRRVNRLASTKSQRGFCVS